MEAFPFLHPAKIVDDENDLLHPIGKSARNRAGIFNLLIVSNCDMGLFSILDRNHLF